MGRISRLLHKIQAYLQADESAAGLNAEARSKARATLTQVLAGKEYNHYGGVSFLTRMLEKVLRFFERSGVFVPPMAAAAAFWIVLSIIICALLACLIGLTAMWIKRRTNHAHSGEGKGSAKSPRKPKVTPESLIREAESLATERKFGEAFRKIYLAMLLTFDKARLIEYDRSRTNWEYVRRIRKQSPPDQSEIVQSMTDTFDKLVYRKGEASPADYQDGLVSYRKLEEKL
jgi:hypothetical protein